MLPPAGVAHGRAVLRVVMREECEHHRYAVRDLAVLAAQT
jgi:hypothetical protein